MVFRPARRGRVEDLASTGVLRASQAAVNPTTTESFSIKFRQQSVRDRGGSHEESYRHIGGNAYFFSPSVVSATPRRRRRSSGRRRVSSSNASAWSRTVSRRAAYG